MTPNRNRGEAGLGVVAGCCVGIGPLPCTAALASASCGNVADMVGRQSQRLFAATGVEDAVAVARECRSHHRRDFRLVFGKQNHFGASDRVSDWVSLSLEPLGADRLYPWQRDVKRRPAPNL